MSAQTVQPSSDRLASAPAVPPKLRAGLPYRVCAWVAEIAGLTGPDAVHWCDGSRRERDTLYSRLPAMRAFCDPAAHEEPELEVGPDSGASTLWPGRSEDGAPHGLGVEPDSLRRNVVRLFANSMRGRTMYVVPYLTLPGEANGGLGIEVTDSPWVVLSLGMITRVGNAALSRICGGYRWAASVHSVGLPLRDKAGTRRPDVPWPCNREKWVATLPASGDIWSFGTGFGAVGFADCMAPRTDTRPAMDVPLCR